MRKYSLVVVFTVFAALLALPRGGGFPEQNGNPPLLSGQQARRPAIFAQQQTGAEGPGQHDPKKTCKSCCSKKALSNHCRSHWPAESDARTLR